MRRKEINGSSQRLEPTGDIDLCLVSKKFGKDPHEEGKYLFRKLWHLKNANIELVGYSPKSFYAKNKYPLLNEIQKSGIELF